MARVIAASPRVLHAPAVTHRAGAAGFAAGATVGALRGDAAEAMVLGLLFAVLAAATLVDLRERRIPNALTYPGLVVAAAVGFAGGAALDMLGGFALAGGAMAAAWALGRGALGMGDVKLSALAGTALGLQGTPLFLVLGTLAGGAVALVVLVLRRDRRATLPYGPALALGAVLAAVLEGSTVT